MNVLYLAVSTARARQVKHDTDFLVGRNVTVDLLTSPDDDWSGHRLDHRVRLHTHQPPAAAAASRAERLVARLPRGRTRARRLLRAVRRAGERRPALPGGVLPHLVVIGGAASLPLAHQLADAYPGLRLTFELDWASPDFVGLPAPGPATAEPHVDLQGADR